MSLVDWDEDDKALLQAEDEAIAAADKPEEETAIPTGTTLQKLIEEAISGTPTPVHR